MGVINILRMIVFRELKGLRNFVGSFLVIFLSNLCFGKDLKC